MSVKTASTIIDVIALAAQAATALATYTRIINESRGENRPLTDAEQGLIRNALLASEARLEAATRA